MSAHAPRLLIVAAIAGAFAFALVPAPADAGCRSRACWDRVHDARAAAWLKRERPAVYYWRREPIGWRQWAIATARCESGDRPHIATGNGFYGWLQFIPRTWYAAQAYAPRALRTNSLPHLLRREHQGVVAIRFAMRHGRGHWPVCG